MTINPKHALKLALGYPPKTSWQEIVKQPVEVKKRSEYKRTKELNFIGWPALKKKYRHLDKQQLELWHAKIYGREISIPPLDSHGRPKKG
jgi:hypothetical protein